MRRWMLAEFHQVGRDASCRALRDLQAFGDGLVRVAMCRLVGADFDHDGKGDLDAVQAPVGSTGTGYFYPGTGNTALGSRIQVGTGW